MQFRLGDREPKASESNQRAIQPYALSNLFLMQATAKIALQNFAIVLNVY